MDIRHIMAYFLMVALAAFLVGMWFYATRERRASRRSWRLGRKHRSERVPRDLP
jgi:hypothetical protein